MDGSGSASGSGAGSGGGAADRRGLATRARQAAAACVHCGFCLPSCPTYQLWGRESDSPRGRIQLADGLLSSRLGLDATMASRIDNCLGCLACVTACPSGVRYDEVLDFARAAVAGSSSDSATHAALRRGALSIFAYPNRLRAAILLAVAARRWVLDRGAVGSSIRRHLPLTLSSLEALAPPVRAAELFAPRQRVESPVAPRGRVAMLEGCVQSVLFSQVNAATERVLAAEGFTVLRSGPPRCCGALALHEGDRGAAARAASRLIRSLPLDRIEHLVVNAAGCGSALKRYGTLDALLAPADRDRGRELARLACDVHWLLAGVEPRAERHRLSLRVAYHDACHLAHGQQIRSEPRQLLRQIPGLTLVELPEQGQCCGSAGLYNVLEPEAAGAIGKRRARQILAAGVDVVATANPGCALQLRRHLVELGAGKAPVVLHPIELIDASLRAADPGELFGPGRSPGTRVASE